MSEQAPERAAPPPSRAGGGGGGNVFTNKIGPLPMWAWVAIIGGLFLAWRLYSQQKASSTQANVLGQTTTPSTPADQVPQFVNQTFTTVTAPLASPPDTDETPPATAPTPTPGSTPPPQPSPAPRPKPIGVKIFPPPTGLHTTHVGASTVGLQWNTVPSGITYPGSYTVAVYDAKGRTASETTVSTPDAVGGHGVATINGLKAKSTYHANVWANGGAQAPQHATVSFKTT